MKGRESMDKKTSPADCKVKAVFKGYDGRGRLKTIQMRVLAVPEFEWFPWEPAHPSLGNRFQA